MKPKRSSDAALRRKIYLRIKRLMGLQGYVEYNEFLKRQRECVDWIFKEICAASTRGYLVGRQPGGILKKEEEV